MIIEDYVPVRGDGTYVALIINMMRRDSYIGDAAILLGTSLASLVIVLLAVAFLIITLITIVLGLWGIGGIVAWIAEILIIAFLSIILTSFIFFRRRRRSGS